VDIRPDRRAWVFIAVAVALASASAALARLWLPGALASGAGAGLSVLAGVWSARGAAALQARDSQQRALSDDVWHVRADRLPLVRDLRDPIALGVHPAATFGASLSDRLPPFVTRQFSSQLGQVLKQDRFVLLVGESTAGKSRAAYEMMRAELQDYRVVEPTRRDGVLAAATCAAATPRTVLWLDDLERFLGSGGLTGAAVRDVLDADGAARFIVATMRSEEYAKFSGRSAPGLEGIGRDALRQGWDVLRLAARIEVPRRWSAEEIGRAVGWARIRVWPRPSATRMSTASPNTLRLLPSC
jgi:eukaryotic-like serine/threonine-protein kinase